MVMNISDQIKRASGLIGSQKLLADTLCVTPSAVNQWIGGSRPVPIEKCVLIERATNGQVTRQELRPNDWQDIWPELTEKAA